MWGAGKGSRTADLARRSDELYIFGWLGLHLTPRRGLCVPLGRSAEDDPFGLYRLRMPRVNTDLNAKIWVL